MPKNREDIRVVTYLSGPLRDQVVRRAAMEGRSISNWVKNQLAQAVNPHTGPVTGPNHTVQSR